MTFNTLFSVNQEPIDIHVGYFFRSQNAEIEFQKGLNGIISLAIKLTWE